jgi:hypothetical protein
MGKMPMGLMAKMPMGLMAKMAMLHTPVRLGYVAIRKAFLGIRNSVLHHFAAICKNSVRNRKIQRRALNVRAT